MAVSFVNSHFHLVCALPNEKTIFSNGRQGAKELCIHDESKHSLNGVNCIYIYTLYACTMRHECLQELSDPAYRIPKVLYFMCD